MTYFDAHTHLPQAHGYAQLINSATPSDWDKILEFCRTPFENGIPAIGIHPWEVSEQSDLELKKLTHTFAEESKRGLRFLGKLVWIICVISDPETQLKAFTAQLGVESRVLTAPLFSLCQSLE